MKTMKYKTAALAGIILFLALTACNNFFHELLPADENQITEFAVDGQIGEAGINNDINIINIPWNSKMRVGEKLPFIVSLSDRAILLPVTPEYLQAAFPSYKDHDELIQSIEEEPAEALTPFVADLIRQNRDFKAPVLDKPIDFSKLVTFLVIGGQGSVRRYTVNIMIYVTFETNDGNSAGVQGVVYGTPISKPNNPFRPGYTFGGWYSDNDTFERPWDFDAVITEGADLYAKWTPVTYIVRYDRNAYDAEGDMEDSIHTYGILKALDTNLFTRENYAFREWNTERNGSGTAYSDRQTVINLSAEDGDVVTLYVQWTTGQHTVTFASNGGSAVPAQSVPSGGNAFMPSDPSRSGYTFEGWFRDNNTFTILWNFNDTVTDDMTLYAKWVLLVYTVSFNSSGGDTEANPVTKTVEPGTTVGTLPAPPMRAGYTFKGWNTQANGLGDAFTVATAVTASITVYAQWAPIPANIVTFDKNGGDTEASPTTKTVTAPATTVGTLPAPPKRAGYGFTGWNTQAGAAFTETTPVTADITVYAQWTGPYILTISYAGGDGTGSEPSSPTSAAYGTSVTMPANTYTRDGYTFVGWEVLSGTGSIAGTHAAGASVAVSALSTAIASGDASITLTAKWTSATTPLYPVTYNADGGSPVPPNQMVTSGTKINEPAEMTKPGHTFDKWYTNSAMTTPASFPITVAGDVSLYAKWTPNTLTITYAGGGGTGSGPASPASAAYGTNVSMPSNTYTRTGYTFDGWAVSGTGSKAGTYAAGASVAVSDLSTAIATNKNASITLTATWKIITYDVYLLSHDSNDKVTPIKVDHGGKIVEPSPPPTKQGYKFVGWFSAETGNKWNFANDTVEKEGIELWAAWERI